MGITWADIVEMQKSVRREEIREDILSYLEGLNPSNQMQLADDLRSAASIIEFNAMDSVIFEFVPSNFGE